MGIGNLTRDAEVRTVGQSQVAKFGLAISEKFKKQDGTVSETTEFFDVELWGQAGVHQYLVKGQQAFVEGSIRTQQWTGNDGQTRKSTFIRATSIQLLGQRPQQPAQAPVQSPRQQPVQQYQQPSAPKQQTYPQYPAQPQAPSMDLPPDNYDPELGF